MPVAEGLVPPHAADDRLAETVARLTRGWLRVGREEARSLGLTLPQLFLLGALRERGSMPVNRWVEMMGVSPSAATGLLDGLEGSGFIVRAHDAIDRRQVLVSLSSEGRKLADRLRGEFRERWRTYCADIPPSRLELTTATLDRILERMGGPTPTEERAPGPRRTPRRAS